MAGDLPIVIVVRERDGGGEVGAHIGNQQVEVDQGTRAVVV